jgi:hypothetical protein
VPARSGSAPGCTNTSGRSSITLRGPALGRIGQKRGRIGTYLDLGQSGVTVYRPACVVRHATCPGSGSKRRSRGARGYAARGHATNGPRRGGAGPRGPPRGGGAGFACGRGQGSAGPSGRGGRAERAQARPHAGRRGSAALSPPSGQGHARPSIGYWTVNSYENVDSDQHAYGFIWRRPDSRLSATRGQARIPDADHLLDLVREARRQGWFRPSSGSLA